MDPSYVRPIGSYSGMFFSTEIVNMQTLEKNLRKTLWLTDKSTRIYTARRSRYTVKMASRAVCIRVCTLVALLAPSSTLSAPLLADELFFKEPVAAHVAVRAGEHVVLECEAAGRPSPTIYWSYNGIRLSRVRDTCSIY